MLSINGGNASSTPTGTYDGGTASDTPTDVLYGGDAFLRTPVRPDVPVYDGNPAIKWRYIAQRATTGEFLDLEVPFLTRSELTWSLSAAGSLKGTVSPDTGTLTAPDGRPLFEEWNTLIFAEANGQIRWGGIVVRSEASNDGWDVECASFATYPNGIPYLGKYYGVEVDPAAIIREVWTHVQAYENGDLGVVVTGETDQRLGSKSEAVANAATAAYDAAKATYDAESKKYTSLRATATAASKVRSTRITQRTAASARLSAAKKGKDPAELAAATSVYNAAVAAVNSATNDYNAKDAAADAQAKVRDNAKAVVDTRNDAKKKATDAMRADGGAYKMLWWDAPDCGKQISDLVTSVPLDFTESHTWNSAKTAIIHRIDVAYPRAGRRRDDLAFIQGDNITVVPSPVSKGDDFANAIFGLGAGEGSAIVHTSTAVNDGRLRRVNVLNSKDTKSASVLQSYARDALLKAAASMTIEQIDVLDHPNAAFGAWDLGDDILVQVDVPFLGRLAIWHRIVSWSLTSDSTARLKLARSDSFSYGK